MTELPEHSKAASARYAGKPYSPFLGRPWGPGVPVERSTSRYCCSSPAAHALDFGKAPCGGRPTRSGPSQRSQCGGSRVRQTNNAHNSHATQARVMPEPSMSLWIHLCRTVHQQVDAAAIPILIVIVHVSAAHDPVSPKPISRAPKDRF